jgi:hypothetical protein
MTRVPTAEAVGYLLVAAYGGTFCVRSTPKNLAPGFSRGDAMSFHD